MNTTAEGIFLFTFRGMSLVEALHQRCPGSLPPTNEALLSLAEGSVVKIGTSDSRFWVVIQTIVPAHSPQDSTFTGIRERHLEIGIRHVIEFQGKHIYEIARD